jgi:hypothetical protein
MPARVRRSRLMPARVRRRRLMLWPLLLAPVIGRAESPPKPEGPPVVVAGPIVAGPLAPGERRTIVVDQRDYVVRGLTTAEAIPRMTTFDAELARFGGSAGIESCRNLLALPAIMAGGTDSFGGACRLSDGSALLVCDDAAMGHFATQSMAAGALSDVASFVIRHCSGT